MIKRTLFIVFVSIIFLLSFFFRCHKDKNEEYISISLRDKTLPIIQTYITGRWKLDYMFGGLISKKYIDTLDTYMILNPQHIIIGDKMNNVIIDTSIVWLRTKTVFNDTTYLLCYSWYGYPWPETKIVDQIKVDTLILLDNANDGFSYFFSKY